MYAFIGSFIIFLQDRNAYFISSIFLRRLLQPGVYQSAALRATVLDYKKYLSDYEFQSLTTTGLKKEILTAIQSEVILRLFLMSLYTHFCYCSCFLIFPSFLSIFVSSHVYIRELLQIQARWYFTGRIFAIAFSATGVRTILHMAFLLILQMK